MTTLFENQVTTWQLSCLAAPLYSQYFATSLAALLYWPPAHMHAHVRASLSAHTHTSVTLHMCVSPHACDKAVIGDSSSTVPHPGTTAFSRSLTWLPPRAGFTFSSNPILPLAKQRRPPTHHPSLVPVWALLLLSIVRQEERIRQSSIWASRAQKSREINWSREKGWLVVFFFLLLHSSCSFHALD